MLFAFIYLYAKKQWRALTRRCDALPMAKLWKNFYLGEERGLREEDVPEVLQKATNIKIELLIDFLERYVYGTKKPSQNAT